MSVYHVPVVGYIDVEAESPEMAAANATVILSDVQPGDFRKGYDGMVLFPLAGSIRKRSPGWQPPVRHAHCVEAWPGCTQGDYDPRCCRFPKSCSCEIAPTPLQAEGTPDGTQAR
jgi:hypothetical protein